MADMKDMTDSGCQNMISVESVNMFDDVYELAPGERHILSAEISTESLNKIRTENIAS